jgi:hypothetical protein
VRRRDCSDGLSTVPTESCLVLYTSRLNRSIPVRLRVRVRAIRISPSLNDVRTYMSYSGAVLFCTLHQALSNGSGLPGPDAAAARAIQRPESGNTVATSWPPIDWANQLKACTHSIRPVAHAPQCAPGCTNT